MDNPLISIVIVTYNRRQEVSRAIDSVINQSYPNKEIIVLDNDSQDDTYEYLSIHYPDLILIRSETNLGCPGGRNKAIRECKGDFIYFLDDDAWFGDDQILNNLMSRMLKGPHNLAVVMPNIMEHLETGEILRYNSTYEQRLFTFSGGVSLVRKEVFQDLGYFPDTNYGAEENYLAIKMFEFDHEIILLPDQKVHHKPSIKRNQNDLVYARARNDLIWLWTYSPRLLLFPLIIWKLLMWLRYGFRKKTGWSGIRGAFNGAAIYAFIPKKDRYSIPFRTFTGYMINRKKTITRFQTVR